MRDQHFNKNSCIEFLELHGYAQHVCHQSVSAEACNAEHSAETIRHSKMGNIDSIPAQPLECAAHRSASSAAKGSHLQATAKLRQANFRLHSVAPPPANQRYSSLV